jgi:hypothetical protein
VVNLLKQGRANINVFYFRMIHHYWADRQASRQAHLWLGGDRLEGVRAQLEVPAQQHRGQGDELLVPLLAPPPGMPLKSWGGGTLCLLYLESTNHARKKWQ